MRVFKRLASIIFHLLNRQSIVSQKTIQNLMQLNPGENKQDLVKKYGVEKITHILWIILAGSVLSILVLITYGNKENIIDGTYIYRNEPGEGSKELTISAKGKDNKASVKFTLEDCSYSKEALEAFYTDFETVISPIVLGSNASWDCITEDLNTVESISGYPFQIEWQSSNNLYLTDSGQINKEGLGKDELFWQKTVDLRMKVIYRDFVREQTYKVTICPQPVDKSFRKILQDMVDGLVKEKPSQKIIRLPEYIQGEKVEWTEQKDNSGLIVFYLTIIAAVAVWMAKDRQLAKQVEKRCLLMDEEYQVIISKLTLYLGAGLNLNSAWKKIAAEGGKNPVYEEMTVTCREMEGGISEKNAYENFAKRVRRQQYIKLITFLVQNLQKGNSEILLLLRQEALLAMENYHALVKRKGEEMGTKLLLPMMLMLGMVMVLIIVPVFFSM